MKTHLLRIILFLCFLASSSFKIQAQTQRLAYAEAEATLTSSAPIHSSVVAPCDMAGRLVQQVTAAQYCDFLNHVATEDLHHLYDEKMATDPQAACIVRVGAPGGYRYKVIAGRGDFPISYVTWLDEARYCNWLEASVASEAGRSEITDDTLQEDSTKRGVYDLSGIDDGVTDDHFSPDLFVSKNLKATCWIFHDEEGLSNSLTSIARGNSYFEMATLSTPSLTLAAATASTASSNSTFNSYIKDVSGVAVIMGLAAFGSIGMVEESSVVGAATREQSSLTLADFRAAATTHPTASRLVIHEDGTIQPREANPDTAGRNRSENLTIHQALRDALTHEYPRRAAELFSSNAKIIDNPSHLSGEALRNIFININNLHNINETKDSNMELVFTNLKVAWSDLMAKADAFTKKRIDLWEVCTAARVVQNSAAQLKQRNRNIKAIEEIAWKIENLSHSITETAFWASDTKDAITVKTAIVHQQEGDVISAVCQLEDSAAKPIVMNVATGLASIVHMNLNISLSAEDLIIQHLISDAKWAVSNVAKGIASKDSQASHAVWSSEFDWAKQVIDEGTQLIEFLSKLIDQKSTESEAVIKISSLESSAHQDFLSEKVEAKSPKAETPQEALFLKTEWKKLDPKQRKVEASIFQKKAARAENSAIDAYIQLLDAYDESNSYEKMSSLANDAYQKAVKAKEAWRKLANAHRIGFELSSDDLNNKDWWGSKFESSKNNEAVWGDALESYQFDYQGNPELKEHGDSLISKRELKEFFYATLINFKETQGPEISQKIRIRILKTMMPNPYVRAEETVNAAGNVLDRQEMIATHLLVRLKEEENPEEFLEKLKKKLLEPLQSLNLSLDSATTLEAMLNKSLFIKRTTPYTPLYELNFRSLYEKNLQNFGLFEEILKVSKSLAVNSEPDYLLEVCTFLDGDSANAVPNDPNYALQWNLDAINGINAPAAWQIIGSPGLFETLGEEKPLIAIIDSGAYQEHQDLQDISCVEGINTVDSDNDTQDNHGHGTHITGIIGAGLNNRLGIAGIVPSVRMMLCKIYGVSRRDSRPSVRSITSAVYYACNHGAKILNCSFYLYHFPELLNAFQYAHEKGIIVVAAAGNEGADNDMNPRFPANYGIDHGLDNVISVAATKENGELWHHSNYGERTVHLAAPGKSILSTAIPGDTNESLLEGSEADHPYLYKSGTSMAAPHVTAALAMMIKEFPGLTYQKLLSRLFKTTDAIPPSGGESRKVRWGRLNLARALSRDRDYSEQNAPSKERADNLNVISEASDAPEQIQKLARERREMAGQAIKYYDKAKVSFEYNNTTEPFNLAKENAGDSWDRAGDAALDAAVQIVLAIDQVKKGKSSQEWEVAAKKAKIALHCFSKAAECYKTENNHNGPDWDAIGEEILRAKEAGGDAWGSVLERSQDFIGRLPEEEQTLLRERIQQAKVQKSEEKATASTEEKVAPSNKGKEKRKSHAESVEGDEVTNTDSQQNCILSSINKK